MAVWQRHPDEQVIIHFDQGSQFNSYEWQDFLKAHNLCASQSRRGICPDNAVAESFFQLLKREPICRKTYLTREDARQDIFDYIEMFYNPRLRNSYEILLYRIEFERQYFSWQESV